MQDRAQLLYNVCAVIHRFHLKGCENLTQIIVKPGEPADSALRRFKKAVMNSGITKEARAHERYEKPSDKKRRELKASLRKLARARAKAAERTSY